MVLDPTTTTTDIVFPASFYRERVEGLRKNKLAHNQLKIARDGFHNVDDHGNIPWDEPIPFERVPSHPDGGSYGIRSAGENFRRWLDVHPVYINPNSALAGAWVAMVPGMGGWATEDLPTHLTERQKK